MTSLDDLRNPDTGPSVVAVLTYMMMGLGIWALHLTLVYGAHTLICALGGSAWASSMFIAAATVIAAAPLLLALLNQRRLARLLGLSDTLAGRRTYDAISRFINILSVAGILWAGATVAIVSSCAQGR